MKFLFVGTNPENTGAATHFVALAQAMVEAGHQVSAVVYPDGLIAQQSGAIGCTLYPAKFRNVFDCAAIRHIQGGARSSPGLAGRQLRQGILAADSVSRLLSVPVALFRHRTPAMGRVSGYLVPRLAQRFFAVSSMRDRLISIAAYHRNWCACCTTR
jgi:hypothetical protein